MPAWTSLGRGCRLHFEESWIRGTFVGFELDYRTELAALHAQFENRCFEYDSQLADLLRLDLEVATYETLETTRKVKGDVSFVGYRNYTSSDFPGDYAGSWTFYTADRFRADIWIPAHQVERMALVALSAQQSFILIISEGPELPALDKEASGKFRFSYRAGIERVR